MGDGLCRDWSPEVEEHFNKLLTRYQTFSEQHMTMLLRDTLDDQQMRDLNELKAWIYDKRIAARLDRDRAGRRERKEEEVERKKQEQPALFEF